VTFPPCTPTPQILTRHHTVGDLTTSLYLVKRMNLPLVAHLVQCIPSLGILRLTDLLYTLLTHQLFHPHPIVPLPPLQWDQGGTGPVDQVIHYHLCLITLYSPMSNTHRARVNEGGGAAGGNRWTEAFKDTLPRINQLLFKFCFSLWRECIIILIFPLIIAKDMQ